MKKQLVRSMAPGSLVLFAAMTTGAPTAHAASTSVPVFARATCGQPAVPAAYESVVHDPVLETVPAVTRLEWLWTRQVPLIEVSYGRVLVPAYDLVGWTRSVDMLEREFARTVVDQAHQPATPGTPEVGHTETRVVAEAVVITEFEFIHLHNGNTRWEREGWNAGAGGLGWSPTGDTRLIELIPAVTEDVWVVDQPAVPGTPEVPEVSHVETTWLESRASAPPGYAATGATRVAGSQVVDTVSLPDGEVPSGPGWVEGGVVGVVDAVLDVVWLPEGEPAPADYTATGDTRPAGSRTETTVALQELAPAGSGWSQVPGSEALVEVEPQKTVEVTAGWVEKVLVAPAVPATVPCVHTGPDVDALVVDAPVVDAPAVGGPSGEAGRQLPATGSGVSLWLVGTGVGSLAAGGALLSRRRRDGVA